VAINDIELGPYQLSARIVLDEPILPTHHFFGLASIILVAMTRFKSHLRSRRRGPRPAEDMKSWSAEAGLIGDMVQSVDCISPKVRSDLGPVPA